MGYRNKLSHQFILKLSSYLRFELERRKGVGGFVEAEARSGVMRFGNDLLPVFQEEVEVAGNQEHLQVSLVEYADLCCFLSCPEFHLFPEFFSKGNAITGTGLHIWLLQEQLCVFLTELDLFKLQPQG